MTAWRADGPGRPRCGRRIQAQGLRRSRASRAHRAIACTPPGSRSSCRTRDLARPRGDRTAAHRVRHTADLPGRGREAARQPAVAFNPADRGQLPVTVERVCGIGLDEYAAGPAPGTVQPDARAPVDPDGQLQRAMRVRIGDQEVREHKELSWPQEAAHRSRQPSAFARPATLSPRPFCGHTPPGPFAPITPILLPGRSSRFVQLLSRFVQGPRCPRGRSFLYGNYDRPELRNRGTGQ